jgi:hypothetical protein
VFIWLRFYIEQIYSDHRNRRVVHPHVGQQPPPPRNGF